MHTRFSKPSNDIAAEFGSLVERENELAAMVRRINASLLECPERRDCLMCGAPLSGAALIDHRSIAFCQCATCGHIQSFNQPNEAFETKVNAALGYATIYPAHDDAAYRSRSKRVYYPKAEWAVDVLKMAGRNPADLRWADIGTGTGGFLHALRELGCEKAQGFERDPHNIRIAHEALGGAIVSDHGGSVADAVRDSNADVYSAFFVLEHVDRPLDVAKALAKKPDGTVFIFSVPVFGFATVFESIVADHYPRNLDGMMHTQLYTDRSTDYFLKAAGYKPAAEWIFGQDAMDLTRFLASHLKPLYPPALYEEAMKRIGPLVDPLQSAIDRARFADARHILAVKGG